MSNLQISSMAAVVFALALGISPVQGLRAQDKKDDLPAKNTATIESSNTQDIAKKEAEILKTDAEANASTAKPPVEKPLWDMKVQPSSKISVSKVYAYVNDPLRIKRSSDESIVYEQKYFSHGAVTKEQIKQRTGEYYIVSWKNDGPAADYILRMDYRQVKSKDQVYTLEIVFPAVQGTRKATFSITGDAYANLGRVTGWRVSVVRDGVILAEKKSFAW